jgi:hypothetical protein
MSRKVLGLDIQTRSVRAVLVKSSLRESRIVACLHVPIPQEGDEEDRLQAALAVISENMDLADTDFAVSIPAMFFSCRNAQVPFSNPKKIRMVLPFEIEPLLPFPAEDLEFDFSVLGPGLEAGKTEVLAAVVEKKRLASILRALSAAHIDPERLTLSGLSLALWTGKSVDPDTAVMCVDAGDGFGSLHIVDGNRIRLVRSFPLPEAPESRERALLRHVRTTLGALAELGLEPGRLKEVVVSGGGMESIDDQRFDNGRPIVLRTLDLRQEGAVAGNEEDLSEWEPASMNGALALALAEIEGLQGLSFHRGQFLGKKIFSRYRENLTKTGLLAAAVLVLMFASLMIEALYQKQRIEDLDRQIATVFSETFPDAKKVADSYQQMKINLQDFKKSATLPGESLPTVRSIDLLQSISAGISENTAVVFDRMVIGPDAILISGSTKAFNTVDEIKGQLERISAFKKVTISSANTDRSGKEVNFQLKVDLNGF